MNAAHPAPEELDALIRLLDDETPEVRVRVAERLALYGGDLSEWLAGRAVPLSRRERDILGELLRGSRLRNLEKDWIVPSGGASALQEDWESFEALLRAISDFLHDGISLRQPLSDALDLLADEASDASISSADELRIHLFESGRLRGSRDPEPRHSDLAWCLAEGRSNPLGLSLIYLLTARRLQLEVEGVDFPGHFMCRIFEDGHAFIVDCFENGRLHLQADLLAGGALTRSQRAALRESADPGSMLMRLLNNLARSLEHADRPQEEALIRKLRTTLG